jgi:hypothetical protein
MSNKDLKEINDRIDSTLERAKHLEDHIVLMAVVLFAVGILVLVAGLVFNRSWVIGSGTVISLCILWPIKRLTDIREKNINLGLIPSLTTLLSNEDAQKEILNKLIDRL